MTPYRTLSEGQRCEVRVGGPAMPNPDLLLTVDDILVEAPNWSLDGNALYLNGHGQLWRLDLENPHHGLELVPYDGLPPLNNDHVLDPDGQHIYLSAMDGHIYRGHLAGGPVDRVTPQDGAWHFLHGVSPDGRRLAYVHIDELDDPGRLVVLEPHGTPRILDTGPGHIDGPEWSPDGRWIYLNTEAFTTDPGHAQIARVPDAGGPIEQVLASDTVDWFPHLSPDAAHAAYIAFPAGTQGHPADLDVEVRVVSTTDWASPLQRYPVRGGQGTINVNSWSPDGRLLAFVDYPGT